MCEPRPDWQGVSLAVERCPPLQPTKSTKASSGLCEWRPTLWGAAEWRSEATSLTTAVSRSDAPLDAGSSPGGCFRIDAEICDRDSNRKKVGSIRELQRWEPPSISQAELQGTVEELVPSQSKHSGDRVWDQFAANELLFGVKSTYQEDMSQYTTPLNIAQIPDSIKKQASKIAREIEKRPAAGTRGETDLWEDDDEENKFSAVCAQRRREPKEAWRSGRPCVVKRCTWVVKGAPKDLP
eukprot:TRINITY_DN60779_c0_g1_i1.p1 TRINITY_DN60779_c0_g1~~TRINITY_DN60779_c0_g1_i1.p1  ORF type:complete len:239 (-),score=39.13 TRINITY_DN60779_c0_g1_i1:444-1160(-)